MKTESVIFVSVLFRPTNPNILMRDLYLSVSNILVTSCIWGFDRDSMAKIKTHLSLMVMQPIMSKWAFTCGFSAVGHSCLLHVHYNNTVFWCSCETVKLACNKEKCLQITNLNLTTMILFQARSVHWHNHNLLEQTEHQENVRITLSTTATTMLTIRPVHFYVILVKATWSHCKLTPDPWQNTL